MGFKESVKEFFIEMWRVLKITKKPGKEEYKMMLKITALGTLAVGAVGFVIYIVNIILKSYTGI